VQCRCGSALEASGVGRARCYDRDAVGDPTTITDTRGHQFSNAFYDDGQLKTTDRPSWWTYDPSGTGDGAAGPDPNALPLPGQVASDTPAPAAIRERSPQEMYQAAQDAQSSAALPTSQGAPNFGDTTPQPLPDLLPQAGHARAARARRRRRAADGCGPRWSSGCRARRRSRRRSPARRAVLARRASGRG